MDSTGLVIVALPEEHDPVWKLSSEKVPHLTLLYLGKPNLGDEDKKHVVDYVEHAANGFRSFSLEVEKRGELGDNKADVLFFYKTDWETKQIETFRSQLLQDPIISTAYASVEQFPEWTPHLTLGFPESPAKKIEDDSRFLSFVRFSRIAVWTDDYSGTTFDLKPYYDMEVAMSQPVVGVTPKRVDAVDTMLAHYGVKGMKWGVRRTDAQLSKAKPVASDDHKATVAAKAKIKSGGTKTLSNQELQGLVNRMNLEKQYSSLTTGDKSPSATDKFLKTGRKIEEVRKFMGTPTGQAIKTVFLGAAAAGAAYATGGASAAAGAGTSLVVRRASNHYTNVGR